MSGGSHSAADFTPGGKRFEVCVIGSGAGGAIVAARLAASGYQVVILEEGGHHTRRDFKMREDLAFPMLYQEFGTRATKDLGVSILQGRAVGGSTVVNWTTSFRTPEPVLDHWQRVYGVRGFDKKDLDPHWDQIEARLNIRPLPIEHANANNRLLYEGCTKLGYAVEPTHRNTRNCFKSGSCGMGCPVDAKQSMLVTYLPDALEAGATLISRCRVDRLIAEGGRVTAVECSEIGGDGYNPTGRQLEIQADRFVLAAGAINTPAILIRSGLGGGMTGRRTFLHPVVAVSARFEEAVDPFYGAPQSVASHAFADRGDQAGFFLEAAPLHPMLLALASTGFGEAHRERMIELPHLAAHIALAIDGFDPSETGGTVEVRASGAPVLDYPLPPRIWEALREGCKTLARIDLAAGAQWVATGHDPALIIRGEPDLERIDRAPFETGRVTVFSAHVMGGAMVGGDPARSVVRPEDLRHHQIANLFVADGSLFPTSLGVNPQQTIFGIAHLAAERWAGGWKSTA
jgi:choline dehydrogenase-like flavoprotein